MPRLLFTLHQGTKSKNQTKKKKKPGPAFFQARTAGERKNRVTKEGILQREHNTNLPSRMLGISFMTQKHSFFFLPQIGAHRWLDSKLCKYSCSFMVKGGCISHTALLLVWNLTRMILTCFRRSYLIILQSESISSSICTLKTVGIGVSIAAKFPNIIWENIAHADSRHQGHRNTWQKAWDSSGVVTC